MNHQALWAHAREWFPLIARSRPVCETVETRLGRLAAAVERHEAPDASLAAIASVLNQGALIASDCGEPEIAEGLCWRQFEVFETARPLTLEVAKIVFEPIVNLSRLAVRDGDPGRGYAILEDLFEAVTASGTATIGGRDIETSGLLTDLEPRSEARRLVWTALLADGTRALVRAGRWREAQRHAEQRKGIGTRLLDGLQVAILADCADADYEAAAQRLATADLREEWERVVACWLTCFHAVLSGSPSDAQASEMVKAAAGLRSSEQGQAVFRTRLRLGAIKLASAVGINPGDLLEQAAGDVIESRDAHAAADILSASDDQGSACGLAPTQRSALEGLIDDAQLGRGLKRLALEQLRSVTESAATQLSTKLAPL